MRPGIVPGVFSMIKKKKVSFSKLSEKFKENTRKNFDSVKPGKLGKVQLAYYNKVKAGKARAAQAYTDRGGKYCKLPMQFIEKYIHPAMRNQGLEINSKTVSKYLKQDNNFETAKNLFENSSVTWTYNPNSIDKALNTFKGNILVNDGNGLIQVNSDELKLLFAEVNQVLKDNELYTFFSKVEFKEGFSKMVVSLPNPEELREFIASLDGPDTPQIMEQLAATYEGFTVVASGKSKSKGKKKGKGKRK